MCYQSQPNQAYQRIETYYRGHQPDKYRTVYRSENEKNEKEGADHAKDFWLVEFANGEHVCDLKVKIPRSDGSLSLTSTDVLSTAVAWIPDVKDAQADTDEESYWKTTGDVVLEAFESEDTHAFVTRPVYLTVAASELEMSYRLDVQSKIMNDESLATPLETAADQGAFEGYQSESISEESLEGILSALMESGYVYRLRNAASVRPGAQIGADDLMTAGEWARELKSRPAGTADEWLLLSSANPNAEQNQALKVHHELSTTTVASASQITSQVTALKNAVQPKIKAYEDWLALDFEQAKDQPPTYGDLLIVDAGGVGRTGSQSHLFYVETLDEAGNATIEMLTKYQIDDSDKFVYYHVTMSKDTYTIVSYDEKYCQRVEHVYTIAADQVNSDAVDGTALLTQWYCVTDCLFEGALTWAVDDEEDSGEQANTDDVNPTADSASGDGEVILRATGLAETGGDLAVWVATNVLQWDLEGFDICKDIKNLEAGRK